MRLVFAGTPEAALPALDALHASRHEVVAALTRPDAPAGRGRRLQPSPVAERALELGIEVMRPRTPSEPEFVERLRALAPECCPVVAYGGLMPEHVLAIPLHGWVNLHFSVLPAWRGAAPVQHALLAGDEVTGATVFEIVPELDAGPTYGLLTEPIGARDTTGDLLERLARHGARLLADTIDHLAAGDIEGRPQPTDGVSYAAKITTEDARVTWTDPALGVDRRIRACTPEPGAWSMLGDERVKIGPVRIDADGPELAPGEIAVTKHAVDVGTATHPVTLGSVQPRGKHEVAAADWARGLRLDEGTRLG